MNVSEYLEKTREEIPGYDMLNIRPAIKCSDGFEVSVQASKTHYSRPRLNYGPYSHVEAGYPSLPVPEWDKWEQDGIYPFIPIEIVDQVLEEHGGIINV